MATLPIVRMAILVNPIYLSRTWVSVSFDIWIGFFGPKLVEWQLQEVGWILNLLHKVPTFATFLPFVHSTLLRRCCGVATVFIAPCPKNYVSLGMSMGHLEMGLDFWCCLWGGQTLFSKKDATFLGGWRKYYFKFSNIILNWYVLLGCSCPIKTCVAPILKRPRQRNET